MGTLFLVHPWLGLGIRMNESSSRVIVSNKTGTPTVTVAAELCKYPINTLRTMNSDRNSSYFF